MLFTKSAVALLSAVSAAVAAPGKADKVIKKDVIIVGGGSSGAHAATILRDDYGMEVALIEKSFELGGHVNSFTDKKTGQNYNYGVQTFVEIGDGNSTAFVRRFGIPIGPAPRVPLTSEYVDFETATPLTYTGPTSAESSAAMLKYLELCEKYEHLLNPGYWNFPKGKDIPKELLMPFGEFAAKHGIEAAVPTIWKVGAMGLGDAMKHMTFYVMQTFGADLARTFAGLTPSWVPASGRSQDLYDLIDAHLSNNVYKSSTVIDAKRTKCGVTATIKNHKTGKLTTIQAKAIVMAIEPTAANMAPFNLHADEKAVFDKFEYTNIWAGILSNEAFKVNVSLTNAVPGIEKPTPQAWLEYPDLPFSVRFDYMGQDKYFRIMMQGKSSMTDAAARERIQADFERLIDAGILNEPKSRKIEYVAWEAHGLMHARAPRNEIENDFITKQYELLGKHSTWWTGGAFSMNFQTSLWEYNNIMIPKLVKAIRKN